MSALMQIKPSILTLETKRYSELLSLLPRQAKEPRHCHLDRLKAIRNNCLRDSLLLLFLGPDFISKTKGRRLIYKPIIKQVCPA
jgi:hypothetical protein